MIYKRMFSRSEIPQQLSKDNKYERWRIRIFVLTWLAYFGFYLTRYAFPAAKSSINLADMDETAMGLVDSAFLIAYAVGQFIWGALADKIGARKVLLGGLFVSIITCIMMGVSTYLTAFLIINLIQGLSQSCGWAPLAKNLSYWFSRKERGTVIGWWLTNYAVGSVVAVPLAAVAIVVFGHWSFAFFAPSACLFVILLLVFIFHAERPQDVNLPSIETYHGEIEEIEVAKGEKKANWLELIKQPMVGLLAATYFLLKPTRYAILLWGPYYVANKLQSGALFAVTINASFAVAGVLGAVVAGTISDKIFKSKRIPFCVICLFTLSVFLFVFDGVVNQTVTSANKNQISQLSIELNQLAEQHEDASVTKASDIVRVVATKESLGNQETIKRMREAVNQLEQVRISDTTERVKLKTMMTQLRKIARSEQLSLDDTADVYKKQLRQFLIDIEALELDGASPVLINLELLLKTKRFEIPETVKRLTIVTEELEKIQKSYPDHTVELARMVTNIIQMKSEIIAYLADRGDDMSFVYRAQIAGLIKESAGDPNLSSLEPLLMKLHDSDSFSSDEIRADLDEIRLSISDLATTPLTEKSNKLVDNIEFETVYKERSVFKELTSVHWVMIVGLFLIGFFVYAPDSLISGVAAIDFGHQHGAASVAGFINGCGSISAIISGVGVGYIAQHYSWEVLFNIFGGMTLIAAVILVPKWNAIPVVKEVLLDNGALPKI